MKVKELKKMLIPYPDDFDIVFSSDEEGNNIYKKVEMDITMSSEVTVYPFDMEIK